RGRLPGADRPHGLIGNNYLFKRGGVEVEQGLLNLLLDKLFVAILFAHIERLTAAEDGGETEFQGYVNFLREQLIVFMEILTPFTVTQNHIGNSDLPEHRGRHFAGVCPRFMFAAVLGAYFNASVLAELVFDRVQIGEGNTEDYANVGCNL